MLGGMDWPFFYLQAKAIRPLLQDGREESNFIALLSLLLLLLLL